MRTTRTAFSVVSPRPGSWTIVSPSPSEVDESPASRHPNVVNPYARSKTCSPVRTCRRLGTTNSARARTRVNMSRYFKRRDRWTTRRPAYDIHRARATRARRPCRTYTLYSAERRVARVDRADVVGLCGFYPSAIYRVFSYTSVGRKSSINAGVFYIYIWSAAREYTSLLT